MASNPVELEDEQLLNTLFDETEEHECSRPVKLFKNVSDENQNSTNKDQDDDNLFDPQKIEASVQVFDIVRQDNCIHEVAVPKSLRYIPNNKSPKKPIKTFPFKLDAFQEEAINCLDNCESVLVSAHTSAGKTVVALYAVALALEQNQRVIYTTPIKALSNQKYRELCEHFNGDVGLITGDVTLNPQASCLVMTTEILRSMLYRGSDIMREVGWVIFDEIHYMNNEERGVVWEESIVLLSDKVRYVFLSATIPNAKQFASWIANLHNQVCHIVYTDYRPTPLQHFFFTKGSDGLYEIVNSEGQFNENNFLKAISFVEDNEGENLKKKRRSGLEQEAHKDQDAKDLKKLIRTIQNSDLLPCIVFSFDRKECEEFAASLVDFDFVNDHDKDLIRVIFDNAIDLLSHEDRNLSQIKWILPFLLRGIGIHHSGLLPILKECIEILFGEGLLKVLFATETFAMGLNMPARTVVFTSAQKYDGRSNRWISGSEYIQMSGRAGRRGTDQKGISILMIDQKMSTDVAKQLIMGKSDPLTSRFRLTYNMVLNLIRVSEISPQYMVERSFRYFQDMFLLPELYKKWQAKKQEYEAFEVKSEVQFQKYYDLEKIAEETKQRVRKTMTQPKHLSSCLQPGRLFKIKTLEADLGWGVLLEKEESTDISGEPNYLLQMVLRVSWDSAKDIDNVDKLRPSLSNQSSAIVIATLTLDCIDAVSTVRVKLPQEDDKEKLKASVGESIQKVFDQYNNVIPELDPTHIVGLNDVAFCVDVDYMKSIEKKLAADDLRRRPNFDELYSCFKQKLQLKEEADLAKNELAQLKVGDFSEQLESRKRVLHHLGFIDNHSVTQKGRVACEINAADSILLTEVLMSGVFNDLSAADCAALLSCFIFDERMEKKPKLEEGLQKALNETIGHARRIVQVSNDCNVVLAENLYIDKLQSGIMSVVKQWCSGVSFEKISQECGIFEGSIIRCLRRLEELLREAVLASKTMGSDKLQAKFEEASVALKREIVFSASLYL